MSLSSQLAALNKVASVAPPEVITNKRVGGNDVGRTQIVKRRRANASSVASILFDTHQAARLGSSDIAEIAMNGVEELLSSGVLDEDGDRLLESCVRGRHPLFDPLSAPSLQLETLPEEEVEELIARCAKVLVVLSEHLSSSPARKVLEGLLRLYKVHEQLPRLLLCAALPFHGTPLFGILASLSRVNGTPFEFLLVVARQSSEDNVQVGSVSRLALAKRCIIDTTLLRQIVDTGAEYLIDSTKWMSFFSLLACEIAGELGKRRARSEDVALVLIPTAEQFLASASEHARTCACMILGAIAEQIKLQRSTVDAVIRRLSECAAAEPSGAIAHRCLVTVALLVAANRIADAIPCEALFRDTVPLPAMLERLPAQRYGALVTPVVLSAFQVGAPATALAIVDVGRTPPKGLVATVTGMLLQTPDAESSRAGLAVCERVNGAEFDDTVSRTLSSVSEAEARHLVEVVGGALHGSVREPLLCDSVATTVAAGLRHSSAVVRSSSMSRLRELVTSDPSLSPVDVHDVGASSLADWSRSTDAARAAAGLLFALAEAHRLGDFGVRVADLLPTLQSLVEADKVPVDVKVTVVEMLLLTVPDSDEVVRAFLVCCDDTAAAKALRTALLGLRDRVEGTVRFGWLIFSGATKPAKVAELFPKQKNEVVSLIQRSFGTRAWHFLARCLQSMAQNDTANLPSASVTLSLLAASPADALADGTAEAAATAAAAATIIASNSRVGSVSDATRALTRAALRVLCAPEKAVEAVFGAVLETFFSWLGAAGVSDFAHACVAMGCGDKAHLALAGLSLMRARPAAKLHRGTLVAALASPSAHVRRSAARTVAASTAGDVSFWHAVGDDEASVATDARHIGALLVAFPSVLSKVARFSAKLLASPDQPWYRLIEQRGASHVRDACAEAAHSIIAAIPQQPETVPLLFTCCEPLLLASTRSTAQWECLGLLFTLPVLAAGEGIVDEDLVSSLYGLAAQALGDDAVSTSVHRTVHALFADDMLSTATLTPTLRIAILRHLAAVNGVAIVRRVARHTEQYVAVLRALMSVEGDADALASIAVETERLMACLASRDTLMHLRGDMHTVAVLCCDLLDKAPCPSVSPFAARQALSVLCEIGRVVSKSVRLSSVIAAMSRLGSGVARRLSLRLLSDLARRQPSQTVSALLEVLAAVLGAPTMDDRTHQSLESAIAAVFPVLATAPALADSRQEVLAGFATLVASVTDEALQSSLARCAGRSLGPNTLPLLLVALLVAELPESTSVAVLGDMSARDKLMAIEYALTVANDRAGLLRVLSLAATCVTELRHGAEQHWTAFLLRLVVLLSFEDSSKVRSASGRVLIRAMAVAPIHAVVSAVREGIECELVEGRRVVCRGFHERISGARSLSTEDAELVLGLCEPLVSCAMGSAAGNVPADPDAAVRALAIAATSTIVQEVAQSCAQPTEMLVAVLRRLLAIGLAVDGAMDETPLDTLTRQASSLALLGSLVQVLGLAFAPYMKSGISAAVACASRLVGESDGIPSNVQAAAASASLRAIGACVDRLGPLLGKPQVAAILELCVRLGTRNRGVAGVIKALVTRLPASSLLPGVKSRFVAERSAAVKALSVGAWSDAAVALQHLDDIVGVVHTAVQQVTVTSVEAEAGPFSAFLLKYGLLLPSKLLNEEVVIAGLDDEHESMSADEDEAGAEASGSDSGEESSGSSSSDDDSEESSGSGDDEDAEEAAARRRAKRRASVFDRFAEHGMGKFARLGALLAAVDQVEEHVVDCVVDLALLMNEGTFRPLFQAAFDSTIGLSIVGKDHSSGSSTLFYKLAARLGTALGTIFVPYAVHFVDDACMRLSPGADGVPRPVADGADGDDQAADGAAALDGSEEEDEHIDFSSDDEDVDEDGSAASSEDDESDEDRLSPKLLSFMMSMRSRRAALEALHAAFTAEVDVDGEHELVSHARFRSLLHALTNQLTVLHEVRKLKPPVLATTAVDEMMSLCSKVVAPAAAELAAAADTETLWKPAISDFLALTNTRYSGRCRLAALRAVDAIFRRLGTPALALVPEAMNSFSELLEANDEVLVSTTHRVLNHLEQAFKGSLVWRRVAPVGHLSLVQDGPSVRMVVNVQQVGAGKGKGGEGSVGVVAVRAEGVHRRRRDWRRRWVPQTIIVLGTVGRAHWVAPQQ
eukprot:CAMPEP_0170746130 /NCGR_PEP_ID=MMETSP0437-20130122/8650_1 /TAXON_ID=0 /ORGANISM="Sexangularia sp." /LENGTH=2161 /DNA_ID=CAMNT_0011084871 /DNA_START=148 /DNA_END=6634 /DNA_ORIENTATION=+